MVTIGVGIGCLILGVIFGDKIKTWIKVKSADAVDTTKRAVEAEVSKVEGK